ncbi:MAG: sulfotransferase, partial [Steroidobacteraceae bacterium]
SGTTLLELTLDAHPQLVSMDEQPFVQNALDDLRAAGAAYPERLRELSAAQLAGIRERYWERVARKVQVAPGQRLVDKNPLNMLRLPVIARLFPNARVILAVRHPCDVILSCYMQHFRAPDFALMCADLPSLTLGYRKAFDFWYEEAALLKPQVHEVQYEKLVADFEAEARRLCAFLQLPWEPAMLDPAQRAHARRFISTPSYSQVVRPVSQAAVDRWRAYEEYLRPALPIVAPYLERWGYTEAVGVNSR